VFVYDGPGQQSMLFERGVPFRYDWEAVLTPVIDTLVARQTWTPRRWPAMDGISQGGFWRAIACQPTGRQLTHTRMLDFLADHLPAHQA
jgi:hypothetical protein